MRFLVIAIVSVFCFEFAQADSYSCAKMVYKDGWLRKYELLGNTWGANIKKSGLISSSVGSSIEKTTSSSDPGVSTGSSMSTTQYSSSWGECSMLDYNITQQMREDYFEQNLPEIKKQIAMGEGYHVDSIAFVSGCRGIDQATWARQLQSNTAKFYDVTSGSAFASELDTVIKSEPALSTHCNLM